MLSLKEVHTFSLNALQSVADHFKWPLRYGRLTAENVALLNKGTLGELNWQWAFATYGLPAGEIDNGILDVSLKIVTHAASAPDAALLCQLDLRRARFSILMMENFIRRQKSALSGKVWLSALIYAHTFSRAIGFDEIYLMYPNAINLRRYRAAGFYEDVSCPPHLSATVTSVETHIRTALHKLETEQSAD